MGGGGNGQRLDHSRQLTELCGDAVTLTGEERDLGACVLDDTACLRPELVGLLAGVGGDCGSLGAGSSPLVVGSAVHADDPLRDLLTPRPPPPPPLAEPGLRALLGVLGVRRCVLAHAS